MLRRRLASGVPRGWATGLLVCLLLTGCGRATVERSRAVSGEQLYVEHCANCHQIDGSGYDQVYPNLLRNPIVGLRDPAPTLEYVLEGRGAMPSFREELSPEEIAEIVSYVRLKFAHRSTVTPSQAG